MKLIEKKCPNCGASLEFSDTDKSCKCTYCHRAFEIERDQDVSNQKDLEQQFTLNEISKGFTFIPIMFALIFIVASSIIGIVIYNMYQSQKTTLEEFDSFDKDFIKEGETTQGDGLYSDISELSNSDYEDIDFDAGMTIKNGEGPDYYTIDGSKLREKVYVAYKTNSDYIVSVYKVNYYKFPHKDQHYTVYVPIVYENINKNQFVDKFANPQIKATEFYFNDEKTSYTYGYGSIDDIYSNVIKPLEEQGYKITEK